MVADKRWTPTFCNLGVKASEYPQGYAKFILRKRLCVFGEAAQVPSFTPKSMAYHKVRHTLYINRIWDDWNMDAINCPAITIAIVLYMFSIYIK